MDLSLLSPANTYIAYGRDKGPLATAIAKILNLELLDIEIDEYADSETFAEVHKNIRGKNVFYIGATPRPPLIKANDVVMEYVFAGDALRHAHVSNFFFLMPYLPYLRQDRTKSKRIALTSKRIIDTIMSVDPAKVILAEPHEERLELAFPANNPVEFLWMTNLFAGNIAAAIQSMGIPHDRVIAAASDHGTATRTKKMSALLREIHKIEVDPRQVLIDKSRSGPDEVEVLSINGGELLKNGLVILPDDITASGATLAQAATAAKEFGATAVLSCTPHGVLTHDRSDIPKLLRLLEAPNSPLDGVILSDTLWIPKVIRNHPRVWIISAAEHLAQAVKNAWMPASFNSNHGSMRDFCEGVREQPTPQPMPATLRQHIASRMGVGL